MYVYKKKVKNHRDKAVYLNKNITQMKYDAATTPLGKAIEVLANATSTGKAAMEAGIGKLSIDESSAWKSLTKGRLGLAIPKADLDTLTKWGGSPDKVLLDQEEYEIKIAHELNHVRHFLDAPGTYAVRGQRGNWSNWDSDPEEELNITGKTVVSVEEWNKQYNIALKDSGYEAYLRDLKSYENEIIKDSKLSLKYKKPMEKLKRDLSLIQLDKEPHGAKKQDGSYIFEDTYCENLARSEKDFNLRLRYSDDRFEPVPREYVPQPYR